ncbi:hypothetical protein Tsubulata_021827 [Turnera subulata]|uniref:Uncharacterized protein n=1 Tax=Turnera subulata TaxID=218843 RepID=A0A9Q0GEP7_9ROSI|nr:hypothetical protein Tsubulata_021827 [Turnera subulata]
MMGDLGDEVTEEGREAKSKAVESVSQGKLGEAVEPLTGAILSNPASSIILATSGEGAAASAYNKMKKPEAAILDADAAIKVNPDSAAMAPALLGQWGGAINDLQDESDYDDVTNEEGREASVEVKANAVEAIPQASVYKKMKKPEAAILDADAAIKVNPDSAAMAPALLGQWGGAINDLQDESDYDDVTNEEGREASVEVKANAVEAIPQASVYKKMKKPEAAILDADAAIKAEANALWIEEHPERPERLLKEKRRERLSVEGAPAMLMHRLLLINLVNPNSAAMAPALLGQWGGAINDLHVGSDYDEVTNEEGCEASVEVKANAVEAIPQASVYKKMKKPEAAILDADAAIKAEANALWIEEHPERPERLLKEREERKIEHGRRTSNANAQVNPDSAAMAPALLASGYKKMKMPEAAILDADAAIKAEANALWIKEHPERPERLLNEREERKIERGRRTGNANAQVNPDSAAMAPALLGQWGGAINDLQVESDYDEVTNEEGREASVEVKANAMEAIPQGVSFDFTNMESLKAVQKNIISEQLEAVRMINLAEMWRFWDGVYETNPSPSRHPNVDPDTGTVLIIPTKERWDLLKDKDLLFIVQMLKHLLEKPFLNSTDTFEDYVRCLSDAAHSIMDESIGSEVVRIDRATTEMSRIERNFPAAEGFLAEMAPTGEIKVHNYGEGRISFCLSLALVLEEGNLLALQLLHCS